MVASQSSPGFVRIRRLKAVEPLALEHSKAPLVDHHDVRLS